MRDVEGNRAAPPAGSGPSARSAPAPPARRWQRSGGTPSGSPPIRAAATASKSVIPSRNADHHPAQRRRRHVVGEFQPRDLGRVHDRPQARARVHHQRGRILDRCGTCGASGSRPTKAGRSSGRRRARPPRPARTSFQPTAPICARCGQHLGQTLDPAAAAPLGCEGSDSVAQCAARTRPPRPAAKPACRAGIRSPRSAARRPVSPPAAPPRSADRTRSASAGSPHARGRRRPPARRDPPAIAARNAASRPAHSASENAGGRSGCAEVRPVDADQSSVMRCLPFGRKLDRALRIRRRRRPPRLAKPSTFGLYPPARGWRGQAPRQPGQVRKEAAVTSPAWVVVQPLTHPSPTGGAAWLTLAHSPGPGRADRLAALRSLCRAAATAARI